MLAFLFVRIQHYFFGVYCCKAFIKFPLTPEREHDENENNEKKRKFTMKIKKFLLY